MRLLYTNNNIYTKIEKGVKIMSENKSLFKYLNIDENTPSLTTKQHIYYNTCINLYICIGFQYMNIFLIKAYYIFFSVAQ